jgi:hypothetical protein
VSVNIVKRKAELGECFAKMVAGLEVMIPILGDSVKSVLITLVSKVNER